MIPFPRHDLAARGPSFWRDLRRERYDAVLDFQGLLKSAIPARLARAARVIGPSFHREGARLFYGEVAGRRNKNRHAVEENLDFAAHLGVAVDEVRFPLDLPREPLAEPRPRIALVPRSRWETKNWPPEYFGALAARVLARRPASFFIVGGPGDEAAARAVAEAAPPGATIDRCGRTSLVELGSLLQEMDLVVTVDSGPMHLAAALGVPVLALFGATDPVRTGPFGDIHRVLRLDTLSCSPCFSDACARGDFACLRNLFPSAVADAALEMLDPVRRAVDTVRQER